MSFHVKNLLINICYIRCIARCSFWLDFKAAVARKIVSNCVSRKCEQKDFSERENHTHTRAHIKCAPISFEQKVFCYSAGKKKNPGEGCNRFVDFINLHRNGRTHMSANTQQIKEKKPNERKKKSLNNTNIIKNPLPYATSTVSSYSLFSTRLDSLSSGLLLLLLFTSLLHWAAMLALLQ